MGTTIKIGIEFGKAYKDKITGLVGVAVAISKYQYGCIRVALQPKLKEDGGMSAIIWLDEPQLEDVLISDTSPGGPRDNPINHIDPKSR